MSILNLYSNATSYRGVKYDTHEVKKCSRKETTFQYRGGTYTKNVEVCK